ncbi:uncharacterized protein LOC143815503 [Ranitomeya variabilis]|uniref:uncharacterized protein LOC143815503 n=1 Tax=Ranitomeya variabilis TaxID=490064 RepID=UPI004055FBB6
MTYSLGQRDPEVGQITLQKWSQIRDLCTLLHSFEIATKMFSADDAIISMTVPVIYMLEHTLNSIQSQVVGQEEEEQEESFAEGIISPRSRWSAAPRRLALEVGGEGLLRAHGTSQTVEEGAGAEEEVEDELVLGMEDSSDEGDLGQISVVRGWGERAEEGSMILTSTPPRQQGLGPPGCARYMSAFLLHYLQHDPRIVKIRSNADYWVATLLDPRYKSKFGEIIPAIERDSRMQEYQQRLLQNLTSAFPQNTSGARSESLSSNLPTMGLSFKS